MYLSDNIDIHIIEYLQTVLMIKHLVLYEALIKSNPSKLILIFGDIITDFHIIVVFLINPYYLIIDRVVNYIYIDTFVIQFQSIGDKDYLILLT